MRESGARVLGADFRFYFFDEVMCNPPPFPPGCLQNLLASGNTVSITLDENNKEDSDLFGPPEVCPVASPTIRHRCAMSV